VRSRKEALGVVAIICANLAQRREGALDLVPTADRKSRTFESDLHALAAWLRIGELKAANLMRQPF